MMTSSVTIPQSFKDHPSVKCQSYLASINFIRIIINELQFPIKRFFDTRKRSKYYMKPFNRQKATT